MGIELAREHIESILGIEVPVGSDRTEPMVLCGLNKVAKKRRMWVSLEMIERVVPEMYIRYMRRDTSSSVRKGGYPTPPKVGHEEAHIISKFHKYTVRRRIELEALKSTNKENVCGPATSLSLSERMEKEKQTGEEKEEKQTGEEKEEMQTGEGKGEMQTGEEKEEMQTGEEKVDMDTPSTLAHMTPEDAIAALLEEVASGEEMAGGGIGDGSALSGGEEMAALLEGVASSEKMAGVVGDAVRVEESLLCNDEEMPCTPLADEGGRKVRMFG